MIKVYGHPRSGNNYLAALVAKNLYPKVPLATRSGYVGHWANRAEVKGNPHGKLFGGHGLPRRYKKLKRTDCYIFRDGRAVALSLWRSKHFINPDWLKGTFSEFLRRPLDWVSSPGDKADPGLTIFEHWKRHLKLWKGAGVQMIRYEELCDNPEPIIREVATVGGFKRFTFKPVTRRVGWFPSSKRSADWRHAYSEEDNEYYLSMVGDCYGVYDG